MNAMKKYFLFLLLIACGDKKMDTVLTPQDFDAKYKATANAILLDVRTPEEIAGGKIANAQNIVWDDSFADKLSTLEHKPIFVYCGSGIRSAKAAAVLKEKGYTDVYELEGGIKAWKAVGMPVE
jgi:rhodanese-related sulfurtransferase